MKNVKIIRELKRIQQEHGGLLMPQDVVEAAKPQASPLHNRFEWNNTAAARAFRLWQARQLISICVHVEPGITDPIPVFCSLSTDRAKGGYRATATVMSDAEMREQLLQDALHELNVFQQKYARLRRLAEVFAAIRRVRRRAA